MPSIAHRNRQRLTDFLPVSALVLAGIVLSVSVFLVLRGYYLGIDRQQFQRDADYYSAAFKSDVERHVTSLAAIHAFVSASHDVNRWEFSAFAHQILPQNSGFKAVLWLPQVGQRQRKAFETNLQRDGLYGLGLRELTSDDRLVDAGMRATYLPVAYVEPFESSGNLIGVDLSTNNVYSGLIAEARKIGRQAASGPVSQSLIDGAEPPIVLVAFPLNRPKGPVGPGSPEGPRGYVLGILQLNAVIADAMGPRAAVQAAIGYGDSAHPSVLLGGQRAQDASFEHWFGDAEFRRKVAFPLAGKQFYLLLRAPRHGTALTRLYAPAGAALLVLTLAAMLAQSMVTTILGKRQVERAVIERTAELRAVNQTLSAEVEQRRQAEAALRTAKDKAESANRAKSVFLSTMSHELRTPLNAIIGFSGMLVHQNDGLDAKTEDYLREINRSGVRLLDLINDILEITQMDTEDAAPQDRVAIADIIEAAHAVMQPQAELAGVTLKAPLGEASAVLQGDARRLQRMLINLFSNAVKFNQKGGWVQVEVRRDGDGLVVGVSDNGPGMPPGAEAQITKLFSQFDSSLARKHEGIGLGLTLVQRVAHYHDAALTISSRQNEGTTVSLRFPAHRVVLAREVA
ncbi:MAG TPA: ATP-binding protein [Rhizomicrobium sp.]|nr:ATP-binding protein [Rhizomicrobium sp.]